MKHFRCYFTDLFLEAKIKVKDDHWQTEEDFKKEIAPFFNLQKDQFQIEDLPPKHVLTDNKKKYDINLSIVDKSKDLIFQLPDKSQIFVKIEHLTSIKYIMEEFKKQKIYFHEKTIESLQFKLCGIKVPKDYNFSYIPKESIVYITSKYNLVPIKYRNYLFYLSESQTVADAASLISPYFKNNDIFQIHDSSNHQMPSLLDKLRNDINYVLYLRHMLNISHINGFSPKLNYIDYLTTVSELKGILASIYSDQEQLTPENIILMDSKKKEISDPDKTLISFPNKFFFDFI